MNSSMYTRSTLAAAIAAAIAAGNAAAIEITTTNVNSTNLPAAQVLYMSGASAQDGAILATMRKLCFSADGDPDGAGPLVPDGIINPQNAWDTVTLDVYNGPSNQRIYFCTAGPGAGAAAGLPIMLLKESNGSLNGVGPVGASTTLGFMNYDLPALVSNCAGTAATNNSGTSTLPGYRSRSCGTSTTTYPLEQVIPESGVTDVEPNMFVKASLATQDAVDNLAQINADNQVIFGVPVNLKLYKALQEAQFTNDTLLNGVGCHPSDPDYSVSAGTFNGGTNRIIGDTEACMPSLSKEVISSLYRGAGNGGITNWSKLENAAGTALTALASTAPLSNNVHICRRIDGSGSQQTANMFFLNYPCEATAPQMPGANGSTVFEGAGTGNVLQCLDSRDGEGKWAIGIASSENVAQKLATDRNDWRFIKVDGYAPTLLNAANGKYQFWVEQVFTNRGTLTAEEQGVYDGLVALLKDPVAIKSFNTSFEQSFGAAGLLGLPNAGEGRVPPAKPITATNIIDNPVNTAIRAGFEGGSPNNCQTPLVTEDKEVTLLP